MSDTKFLFIVSRGYQKSINLDNIASFEPKGSGTEFVLKELKDGKNVIFFCDEPYLTIVDTIRLILKNNP